MASVQGERLSCHELWRCQLTPPDWLWLWRSLYRTGSKCPLPPSPVRCGISSHSEQTPFGSSWDVVGLAECRKSWEYQLNQPMFCKHHFGDRDMSCPLQPSGLGIASPFMGQGWPPKPRFSVTSEAGSALPLGERDAGLACGRWVRHRVATRTGEWKHKTVQTHTWHTVDTVTAGAARAF